MAWYRSTTNTTGITTFDTPANALSVLNTFFTACAAEGASFLWTVASYQSTSPRYLVLKRKSGANGRLMFFGGDTPAAAVLGPSVTANTTSLYVGYDRTAAVDTPSVSYATGRPFGGSIANWHPARPFSSLNATAQELRAYCNSSNDTIAVFLTDASGNLCRGHTAAGLWLRNEGGTACEGLITNGATTSANLMWGEPMSVSFNGSSATAQAVQAVTVYDATLNEVIRLAGLQTAAATMGSTQAIHNERYISPAGYAKFFPATYAVPHGGTVAENRLYSSRYIGFGPMKTLNFQWTDNAAAPKGYYVGFINTTADLSGLSLMDDSF